MTTPANHGTIIIRNKQGLRYKQFYLTKQTYTFGSDPKCDLIINRPGVLPIHAELMCNSYLGAVYLRNWSEGELATRLNGTPIAVDESPPQLCHGDLFVICSRTFEFRHATTRKKPKTEKAKEPSTSTQKRKIEQQQPSTSLSKSDDINIESKPPTQTKTSKKPKHSNSKEASPDWKQTLKSKKTYSKSSKSSNSSSQPLETETTESKPAIDHYSCSESEIFTLSTVKSANSVLQDCFVLLPGIKKAPKTKLEDSKPMIVEPSLGMLDFDPNAETIDEAAEQTKPLPFNGCSFLISGLSSREEYQELKKVIRILGGRVLQTIKATASILESSPSSKEPTTFFIGTKKSRTTKFIFALLNDVPCIHKKWLLRCAEQKKMVSFGSYLITERHYISNFNLEGKQIGFLDLDILKEPKEDWTLILKACGATLRDWKTVTDLAGLDLLLFFDSQSAKLMNLYSYARGALPPVISCEWLMQCIFRDEIMDPTLYLLATPPSSSHESETQSQLHCILSPLHINNLPSRVIKMVIKNLPLDSLCSLSLVSKTWNSNVRSFWTEEPMSHFLSSEEQYYEPPSSFVNLKELCKFVTCSRRVTHMDNLYRDRIGQDLPVRLPFGAKIHPHFSTILWWQDTSSLSNSQGADFASVLGGVPSSSYLLIGFDASWNFWMVDKRNPPVFLSVVNCDARFQDMVHNMVVAYADARVDVD